MIYRHALSMLRGAFAILPIDKLVPFIRAFLRALAEFVNENDIILPSLQVSAGPLKIALIPTRVEKKRKKKR